MVVHPTSHGDSSCPVVLWIQAPVWNVSSTRLSLCIVGLPIPFDYILNIVSLSVTPHVFLLEVWPLPRSLDTTSGISFDFSSSAYLDVSVQQVPPIYLFDSVYSTWTLLHVGFPIRKSADQNLFATPRSLSQLATSFFGDWCQGILLALFHA